GGVQAILPRVRRENSARAARIRAIRTRMVGRGDRGSLTTASTGCGSHAPRRGTAFGVQRIIWTASSDSAFVPTTHALCLRGPGDVSGPTISGYYPLHEGPAVSARGVGVFLHRDCTGRV